MMRKAAYVLGILALMALAAVLAAPLAIKNILEGEIAKLGFPHVQMGGVDLSLSPALSIRRIQLAPNADFRLEDLQITANWRDLFAGKVDNARLRTLVLRARIGPDGRLRIPGYVPPEDQRPGALLPLNGLNIDKGEIRLGSVEGPLDLSLSDARFIRTDDGFDGSTDIRFQHRLMTFEGKATAELAQTAMPQQFALSVAHGQMGTGRNAQPITMALLRGQIFPEPQFALKLTAGADQRSIFLEASGSAKNNAFDMDASLAIDDLAIFSSDTVQGGVININLTARAERNWSDLSANVDAKIQDFKGKGSVDSLDATLKGVLQAKPDSRDWAFSGRIDAVADIVSGTVQLDDAQLHAPSVQVIGKGDEIRVQVDRCINLDVSRIQSANAIFGNGVSSCLWGGDDGVLAHLDQTSQNWRLSLSSRGDTERIWLSLAAIEEMIPVAFPRWTLDTTHSAANGLDGTLSFMDGALEFPDPALDMDGITGLITFDQNGLNAANFTISTIKSRIDPAPLVPLSAELSIAASKEEEFTFKGFLSDPLGLFVSEISGTANEDFTAGTSTLKLYPINFISGALEISDISPLLSQHLSDVTGTLGFNADVRWQEESVKQTGQLMISSLSFDYNSIGINDLSAQIDFSSLSPLTTPPNQIINIGLVNIGLPATDGRITLHLQDQGRLAVSSLNFALAGGTLSADPFMIDLSDLGNTSVLVSAQDIDLTQMIVSAGVTGLSGSGRLAGTFPVSLSNGRLFVEDGALTTVGSGTLHYTPEDLPAFMAGDDMRAQMLRQVLQDFRYETLSLSLAGELSGDQLLNLRARGANPDFLDGHPIELNFNLQGPVTRVIKSTLGEGVAGQLQQLFKGKGNAKNQRDDLQR